MWRGYPRYAGWAEIGRLLPELRLSRRVLRDSVMTPLAVLQKRLETWANLAADCRRAIAAWTLDLEVAEVEIAKIQREIAEGKTNP